MYVLHVWLSAAILRKFKIATAVETLAPASEVKVDSNGDGVLDKTQKKSARKIYTLADGTKKIVE